jgi:MFS transporter, DHA1 family, multidrug resistance protein
MKHVYVVLLAILSYLISTDVYTPSMPEIARHFGHTSDEVQRTMSFFLAGAVMACIGSGIFADQIGKKKFLMYGMALAMVGSLMTIFAPSLEWLVLGRFVQGLGGGLGPVLGFAIIQELYPEDKQAQIYGMMGMLLASIPAVAPFFGGVISTYFGWHVIFVFLGIMFAASFYCVWRVLPDSLNHQIPHSSLDILKSYKTILTSRAFLALALLSPFYNSIEWFAVTYLPFYMQNQIGITPEFYGFLIGIFIVGFGIGSYGGGKLITTYGIHKTISLSLFIGLLSALMLWATTVFAPLSAFWICLSLSVFFTGFGALFPSSVSSTMSVFKEAKTRASSIRSLFITSFAFVGSFNAEWVDDTQLSSLAAYVTLCCVLAIATYMMRVKTAE